MTDIAQLVAFLATDARDVGCDQAWDVIHTYAEMVIDGETPDERYPGITAHLMSCHPCWQDFEGVLNALRNEAGQVRPA